MKLFTISLALLLFSGTALAESNGLRRLPKDRAGGRGGGKGGGKKNTTETTTESSTTESTLSNEGKQGFGGRRGPPSSGGGRGKPERVDPANDKRNVPAGAPENANQEVFAEIVMKGRGQGQGGRGKPGERAVVY